MRMPRLRFSLRWPILAVAVVAAWLAFTDMNRRSREYNHAAKVFGYWAFDTWESGGLSGFVEYGQVLPIDAVPPDRRANLRLYLRHLGLHRKYERAARYPWLPVAPDPK